MKIGFIGLGRMGGAMARRLLAHGYDLRVYDRDVRQTSALADAGAHVASDIATACHDRELMITMLPNDALLREVTAGAGGLCDSMQAGAIHMVSGTHGVAIVDELTASHTARDQVLVSCTVLGRPDRAAAGKLGLIAAGLPAAVDRMMAVLGVLGERVFRAGANPVSAVAIKIANNFVLGCAIEAIGEGMALVRKYEVDPEMFHTVLTEGLFNCVAYQAYGDVIAKEDWTRVGATVVIGLKDAQLAFEAAAKVNVPLPSGNVWRDHLLTALGRGEESLDWAVMAREQFRNSGLEK